MQHHPKILAHRRSKPIFELERKWNKAKGRTCRHLWCDEYLDLAHAKANKYWNWILMEPTATIEDK